MNCKMKIVFHFVFLLFASPEGAQASAARHQAKRRVLEQRPIVISEAKKARKRSARNCIKRDRQSERDGEMSEECGCKLVRVQRLYI